MRQETVQWLTENGFNPHQLEHVGKYQDTALILAARRGETAVLRDLLEAGANVHHRNMDGTTALWAACVADDTASAELLLEYGSDLNNQNDNGATVLMYAASTGKAKWVHFLLRAGADDQLRSLDGYSALELAATVEILRLLKGGSGARRGGERLQPPEV